MRAPNRPPGCCSGVRVCRRRPASHTYQSYLPFRRSRTRHLPTVSWNRGILLDPGKGRQWKDPYRRSFSEADRDRNTQATTTRRGYRQPRRSKEGGAEISLNQRLPPLLIRVFLQLLKRKVDVGHMLRPAFGIFAKASHYELRTREEFPDGVHSGPAVVRGTGQPIESTPLSKHLVQYATKGEDIDRASISLPSACSGDI